MAIDDQLQATNCFLGGDSARPEAQGKMEAFLARLRGLRAGAELGWTLVLDDPAGNSYLENPHAPDADPQLTVEDYERDYDQNELLGLNDMRTEGDYSAPDVVTTTGGGATDVSDGNDAASPAAAEGDATKERDDAAEEDRAAT